MRVVMVSKALVVAAYQRKAAEIARLGVDLIVLVPPFWSDSRGRQVAEQPTDTDYELRVVPIRFQRPFSRPPLPNISA